MNRHNVSEPKEKTVSNENGPGETEKGSRSEIQLEDASNGPGQQTGLSFEKSPADRIAKAAPVGSLDPCRQLAAPADPLEGLDPYQRVAAETRSGPLLIVAGPGTGKTRTLVSRIAHQVGSGAVQQEQVLALSFTNQAAEELRERLRAVLPERGAPGPLVTTFHGLGKHLLETLGDTPVTLLEDEARETLVREVAGSEASPRAIKTLGHQISLVKQSSTAAELCLRRAVETSAPDDSGEQVSVAGAATEASFVDSARFAKVFCKYEAKLEASGEMDIDDLVLRAYRMLAADSSLAESVERRFRSVSVDEYQDVNDVQAALVRLLCPGGETLCAIGDPHQAIYGFRGAQPGHFQRFLDEYPGARQVRLDTTYRLTRQVLAAAQAALGVRDRLEAHRTGPEVELVTCPSARSEAEQVLVRLERIVGGTSYFAVDSGRGHTAEDDQAGFGDIAVLTRTRAQQRLILKALGRSAVPCRQVGEDEPHDPRAEKVAVMTMHAAKGREFQVVFVTGLEEGLMPLKLEGFDADPDEERRLLYVAITRAKHLAVLSLASRRVLFGKALPGALSPFLRDLPPDAVVRSVPGLPRPKDSSRQMSLF